MAKKHLVAVERGWRFLRAVLPAAGPGPGTRGSPVPLTGGVAGPLLSLESRVGLDSACAPLEEEGVKAVSLPTSVRHPNIVSKLLEDWGSKVSLASLEDMICFWCLLV